MKMYELLDKPEKWTQGFIARDESSNPTAPLDDYAVCWCLLGALDKCYPRHYLEVRKINKTTECRLSEAIRKKYSKSLVQFNDNPNTTFDQVRSILLELDI